MSSSSDVSSNNYHNHSNSDSNNKLSRAMQRIFSFNGNLLLAAIISLLLVLLFVLLLHIYAKWFLALSRRHPLRPRPRQASQSPDLQTITFRTALSSSSSPNPKGLHSFIIASIPLFVYQRSRGSRPGQLSEDCVVCLSEFEEGEAGRELPRCGHRFHVECIDMWLHSHTNCPICRSPAVASDKKKKRKTKLPAEEEEEEDPAAVRASGILRTEQIREMGSSQTSPGLEIVIECDLADVQQVEINDEQAEYDASSSSSMLGSSLKRMLSRGSRPDSSKIHPSIISVNEC